MSTSQLIQSFKGTANRRESLMASITKETEETGSSTQGLATATPSAAAKAPSASSRPDAVSLEVPVKIHGSRASAGPDVTPQMEPFEEQTTTMIVFPQGGVLRMMTVVSAGQMLVVTNLKSRQDAICRVVKVRNFPNMQSYVEVEFTHAQAGYWGVYFPSEAGAVKRGASPAAAASGSKQEAASDASRASAAGKPNPTPKPSGTSAYSKEIGPLKPPVPSAPAAPPKPSSAFVSMGSQEKIQPAASATSEAGSVRRISSEKQTYAAQPLKAEIGLNVSLTSAAMDAGGLPSRSSITGEAPALHPSSDAAAKNVTLGTEVLSTADSVLADLGTTHVDDGSESTENFRALLGAELGKSTTGAGGQQNWALIGVCLAVLFAAVAGGVWYFHSKAGANNAEVTGPVASSPSDSAAPEANSGAANAAAGNPSSSTATSVPVGLKPNVGSASGSSTASVSQTEPDRVAPSEPKVEADAPQPASSNSSKVFKSKMKAHPLSSSRSVDSAAQAPAIDSPAVSTEQPGEIPGIGSPSGIAVPPPPGAEGDGAMKAGGKATAAKLISSTLPIYPSAAKQAHIQGDVVVDTQIDKKGNVVHMEVVSGPEMLRQAALDALRKWKYKPSQLDGQPVPVEVLVNIKFRL